MDTFQKAFVGACLKTVELSDHCWVFSFDNGAVVRTPVYWRVIADGRIAVAECDHGHQFGLPAPKDVALEAKQRLTGKVSAAAAVALTGDLQIAFESDAVLEFLNTSSGYEGWHLTSPAGELIAMGGGKVAPISDFGIVRSLKKLT